MIGEIYKNGDSTRKTQSILKKLRIEDISTSEVSQLNKELDKQVEAFRTKDLSEQKYLFLYVNALYEKIRLDHHIVFCAIEIVYSVNVEGYCEIIAIEPMVNESYEIYYELFNSL